MTTKASSELDAIVEYSRDEAMRTGSYSVGADHLALAMLRHSDNGACRILDELGVRRDYFKQCIEAPVFHEKAVPFTDAGEIALSGFARGILQLTMVEAMKTGSFEARAEHLLLALLSGPDNQVKTFLESCGVIVDEVRKMVVGRCSEAKPVKSVRKFTFTVKRNNIPS